VQGLDLTPEEAAERKRRASYRLHVQLFPLFRLIGFAMVCLVVVLDTSSLAASHAERVHYAELVGAYCVLSWLVLRTWFRTSRLHLGLLFLALDVPFYCRAIQLTGAEYSWYFLLLIVRIADQIPAGPKRTLAFTHICLFTYLGMLGLNPGPDQVVDWHKAFEKGLILYLAGLYLSLSAVANEGLRRRASQALATARELIQQLEEANLAKTRFLANTSHELRTPINGIMGMLELALNTDLPPALRADLTDAHRSSQSLLRVLNDILDYAKLESGTFGLHTEAFQLERTLAEVTGLMQPPALQKGLSLKLEGASDLPRFVVADRDRLRQIVLNLVHNAIKFTEKGAVTVSVEWKDECLWLEVADTGCGIEPEQLERMFEPFVQEDDSLARSHGGTGLGLTISRELAQRMGGELTATSVVGEGSRFLLKLPMQASMAPESEGAPANGASDRRLHVLVVEDNVINQKVCRRMLENCGHVASVVGDGEEALAALEGADFDVVLMDIQIPRMDGLEVTRRVRAAGRDLPIIALTAHATRGTREQCLEQGMTGFLEKPLRQSALNAILQTVK